MTWEDTGAVSPGFQAYDDVKVNETPVGFQIFAGVYVFCCFIFIIPVVYWKRRYKRQLKQSVGASSPVGGASNRAGDLRNGAHRDGGPSTGMQQGTTVADEQRPRAPAVQEMVPLDSDIGRLEGSSGTKEQLPFSGGKNHSGEGNPTVTQNGLSGVAGTKSSNGTGITDQTELQGHANETNHYPVDENDMPLGLLSTNSTDDAMSSPKDTEGLQSDPTPLPSTHQQNDPIPVQSDKCEENQRKINLERIGVVNADEDRVSAVPSAATTSRLRHSDPGGMAMASARQSRNRAFGSRIRDKRWTQFTPSMGRKSAMQRFVQAERLSAAASEEGSNASRSRTGDHPSRSGRSGPNPTRDGRPGGGMVSDAASSILAEEVVEGEANFYRQRYVDRSRRNRWRSFSSASDRSLMPPLSPDALSPEDAADANDPGRSNQFTFNDMSAAQPPSPGRFLLGDPATGPVWSRCGKFLELVELDFDTRRVLRLAFPSVAVAIADPILRLVLIAIISHFIGTSSMVAFVLVIIFVRVTTEEISGAITDTETNMIQFAMANGGEAALFLAGQYIQLAMLMQIIIGIPVMVVWALVIGALVDWLLSFTDPRVANLASQYTAVIVIEYLLDAVSRTFMLPYNMNGRPTFEIITEVMTAVLTMVAIGIIASTEQDRDERPTLVSIGWVQVVAMVAKTAVKVFYVVTKGWFQPYKRGFFGRLSLIDSDAVATFLLTALPLFVGSLLELREWDILTLFIRAIGPGEVSSWAVMGVVWEVFEATTEGLGSAGAVRISYYLSENLPEQAKRMSMKVVFLAAVQAFSLVSFFLILGPNITVALIVDPVLQDMFLELVGMTSLAYFSMTFAQIFWSLVGAQGRFSIATAWILVNRWFVIFPIAAICVFGYHFESDSVSAAVAIGYSTAAFALAYVITWTDWPRMALEAREEVSPTAEDAAELSSVDAGVDEDLLDDDDDSSDGSSVIL